MPDSGGPAPNPAERVAAFAAALRAGDVPAAVRERARHLILDALGVAAASSRQEFARVMLEGFRAAGGGGGSGVVAMGTRLSLRDAAALNAALIHGLDFDDTHPGAVVHCTAVSLPAALALGEERDAPGEEILTAYIAAMECAARIGLAADYGFHRRGFHATGIAGHFSSALAAGRLMGLDGAAARLGAGRVRLDGGCKPRILVGRRLEQASPSRLGGGGRHHRGRTRERGLQGLRATL